MTQEPKFSTDRFALKLGLFYAAYFLYGGVQLPFFPLWLESRGLDARAIRPQGQVGGLVEGGLVDMKVRADERADDGGKAAAEEQVCHLQIDLSDRR